MITYKLLKLKTKKMITSLNFSTDTTIIQNMPKVSNFICENNPLEKIKLINKNLEFKIKEFQKNPEKLVIVSDFDYTLSKKFHHKNQDTTLFSSYCVLEAFDTLSEKYRKVNKELFEKYHPIEIDHTMDFKERDLIIHQWFRENLDLLVDENLTKESFQKMVTNSETKFFYRYGIIELFELIKKYSIPLYIISGGIFEIIDESMSFVIPQYKELREKKLINIVANKFRYDEENKVIGYEEPCVYTFNKGKVNNEYNLILDFTKYFQRKSRC